MIETKFKQTEIGLIPEDWEVKRLGEISQDASYGVSAEAISYDGKNKYIRITDIDDKYRIFIPSPLSSPAFFDKQHILKSNDILFARTGASVGKSYLYNLLDGILVFAGFLMKLNIQYEDSRYVFYETLTNRYKKWILQESMRSGQPGINIQQLKSFPIILPPLPEQRRISAALTSIDNLITSLSALKEKKKQLKQGTMQQLITGKRRLPGFYGEWVEKKLGEIAETSSGGTPNRSVDKYYNGTIKWFTTGELSDSYLYDSKEHISEDALKFSSAKLFDKGTLLIAMYGATIGKLGILKNPASTNQACCAIKSQVLDMKFIFYNLLYNRTHIIELGRGAGQPNISQSIIQELTLQMPPTKQEQTRIAAALTSIDNLITSLLALIEKKKQLKQGTMQQLLTGKRRLPGFYGEWVEKKLGDICEFANGYTPSKEVASFWTNGTIPWFRMEDIRTNGRVLSDSIQHITKIAVKGQLFPSNSIIISTTATIGEHALIIVDSLANQRFTNLKIRKSLSKSISIDWLFHYCFVLGEWCRNNINEGGLAAVNMDDFSSHEMIMPPTFSEQTAIANVLTAMDNEIAALEAKRAKYEAIKQGMMQQLLTGKIRLVL